MVTILLEQIIELLKGFIDSFKDHAAEVAEKLGLISEDTSDINDNTDIIVSLDSSIKDNTDILVANTGAIKNSSQATSVNTAAIASDTNVIRNNINTISVNSGKTAAFTEDVATNTLNILDKVTTIASDTTQMRSDNQVIIANTNDLETYVKLLGKGLKKESYADGSITSFNTDLKDILNSYEIQLPASTNGYNSIEITRSGVNLLDLSEYDHEQARTEGGAEEAPTNPRVVRFRRIPADKPLRVEFFDNDPTVGNRYLYTIKRIVDGIVTEDLTPWTEIFYDNESEVVVSGVPNSYIRIYLNSNVSPFEAPFLFNIMVTEENEAHESVPYIPFAGDHYYIDLDETLTIGGKLNVKTGLLTRTDGTTKQLQPLDIKTLIGDNNIYNSVAGFNDISYNETIYNLIEREV